jgi:hypothetical protein
LEKKYLSFPHICIESLNSSLSRGWGYVERIGVKGFYQGKRRGE